MTAVKPSDVSRFLKSRPAGIHLILFHGPDQGLVRDRALQMARLVVEDLNDPFNAIELGEQDITSPGQLADEAAALSFMGGERLIRVRGQGDPVTKAVKTLIASLENNSITPNALVIVEAGELKKTSALRKAVEATKTGAAIACYPEEGAALAQSIRDVLDKEGLTTNDEVLAALTGRLGEDRGLTLSELEKLSLYKGTKEQRHGADDITLDDLRAALAESTADATFDIIELTLEGQTARLSEALYRARGAGVSLLGVLRILQGKLLRLLTAQEAIDRGQSRDAAMKSLRPPVFYGEQKSFARALSAWPLPRLRQATQDIFAADLSAKQTAMPQTELVERALLRLSMMAGRQ